MEIITIGSSSSGNSYIVKTGKENLILDLGLSAKTIGIALEQSGLHPEQIDAILITHEHIDHVRSVRAISKTCTNADYYVSRGTVDACSSFEYIDDERIHYLSAGDEASIGDVTIRTFALSHDATEPIGYSFISNGEQLSVVTDTGVITDEIFQEMKTADKLVFESNHEENLLMMGEYPYSVKMRIKSDVGHLSNVAAGETIAKILSEREKDDELEIILAHLSRKNNTPYQARLTIEEILKEKGFESDRDYFLTIAPEKMI